MSKVENHQHVAAPDVLAAFIYFSFIILAAFILHSFFPSLSLLLGAPY